MSILRLVLLSDTHNQLGSMNIPDGDILLHSGDLTMGGKQYEIEKELGIMGKLPHKHKLFIAGNHDFLFETHEQEARRIALNNNLLYIHEQEVVIEGIKFYGSNYQPWFYDWAFNLKRGKELADKWALIPDDTNVLLTHGPAFGILDKTPHGENVGCEDLSERIKSLKQLQLHVFGHIHCDYGIHDFNGYIAANASNCTERYSPRNLPIVLDYNTISKVINYV